MGKRPGLFLFLLAGTLAAAELPLMGFEPMEVSDINVKLSASEYSAGKGRVTAVIDSVTITVNRSFAVGRELLILHANAWAGEARVTVAGASSTARVFTSNRAIAAGDSIMPSYRSEDTLQGIVTLAVPYHVMRFPRGNASRGDYSLGLARVETPAERPLSAFTPIPAADPEPWRYYGMFQNGSGTFNTCGLFRALFPADWSAYDLLRIDAYAQDVNQVIQIALEDEIVGPMVIREYTVTAGSWTTLEFDLRQAARDRNLDLTKMTGLHAAVREAPGKARGVICGLIDNIRLSTSDVAASLPVVRDASSMALPAYYRHNTTPGPEVMPPGTPDRAPVSVDSPRIIIADSGLHFFQTAFISAYDNRNLLAGFARGVKLLTLATADAGATWTGLAGEPAPTQVPATPYPDHQSGRGETAGSRGDVLLLANNCAGGAWPNLRLHAYLHVFDGTRWNRSCRLMDCDPRHCVATHTALKTADGRLWTSYGVSTRLNTIGLSAQFTDDDGQSWKAARENTSGIIPWSLIQPSPPLGMKATGWLYYASMEPHALVPFGNSVACLVQTGAARTGRTTNNPLVWMRLEAGQWTAPETIPVPAWTSYYYATFPGLRAVSPDGREIFAVSSFFNGVLHYKDGVWRREAADIPYNSFLSVAGGRTVVAVGAIYPGNDFTKGPVTLRAWQFCRDGNWSAPVDVAREERPIFHSPPSSSRFQGFVIPTASPANFVPLMWCTDTVNRIRSIKFVRIPVDTNRTGMSRENAASVILDAPLRAFPNPFSGRVTIRAAQNAQAAVYAPDGRCVWKAVAPGKTAQLEWDGGSQARGVYILKVRMGMKTQTLTLVRL